MDDFNYKAKNTLAYTLFLISVLFCNSVVFADESTEYRFDRLWPQLDPINYSTGGSMDVASDGSIYILQDDNSVRQFSAEGKLLQTWEVALWSNGDSPDVNNIVVGPDDSIYLSNALYSGDSYSNNYHLHHLSSQGELIRSWGSLGKKDGAFGDWIGGIAVSENDHIYVSDSDNSRVQQFDVTGKFIRNWSEWGDEGFYWPTTIVIAPDKTLYISNCWEKTAQFTADGEFIRNWEHQDYRKERINNLSILAVSEEGDFYFNECLDEHFNNPPEHYYIHQFNAAGKFIRTWKDRTWWYPEISPLPNGDLYVASSGEIEKYTKDGKLLHTWSSEGDDAGRFNQPTGITIAPDNSVYITDTWNHRIQQFDADGNFIRMWGKKGAEPSDFDGPTEIAIAQNGDVYIAGRDHYIQQFSGEGKFIRSWGGKGTGDMQFSSITAIAEAPNNTLYVLDYDNQRVQQFTLEGEFIREWGGKGTKDRSSELGKFHDPQGLTVGHDGSVYVTDTMNNRIQQFSAEGEFIRAWNTILRGENEEIYPRDISLSEDGSLYVSCSDNLILHYSSQGKFISSWQLDSGVTEGQFRDPRGITTAPDGSMYIVDSGNNRIQKFVLH